MDILKLSIDWAKDEVFSAKFFILFGLLFIVVTIAFYQLGKTEMARAFITPTLVTGILLLIVGSGLLYSNQKRINEFPRQYEIDATAFLASEIERADRTIQEYSNVFKVIPAIVAIAALLIVFVDKPIWRAACIATIAMMVVIMSVDINAKARIEKYREVLLEVSDQ